MPPVPTPSVSSNSEQCPVEAIQLALREQLGSKVFANWFGKQTQLNLNGHELCVQAQSPYIVKWIQKRYHAQLTTLLAEQIGPAAKVRYSIQAEGANANASSMSDSESRNTSVTTGVGNTASTSHGTSTNNGTQALSVKSKTGQTQSARVQSVRTPTARAHGQLRSLRLDGFVVGPCNDLAAASAEQTAKHPGEISPLYIHSSVGNGKSHLLEGIRARLRKLNPSLHVMLITSEQFTNYFTQAFAARTLPSFRHRFRGVDVLLVDDVDFFDGKKSTQEEFLHTIKQFEMDHRQVVVTANRHPRLLTKTPDELTSRFVSGLVCRIDIPDDATRLEIVRRCVLQSKSKFSDSAIEYIASRFKNNVRELEGAVNLLATWGKMSKRTVTAEPARQILSRLERDCMKIVRMTDIESAVCEMFGVNSEELRSPSRKKSIAQPRMLAMYLARRLTEIPYSEIGQHFGGRNHSTVMSAEKKIDLQIISDERVRINAETWQMNDLLETLKDRIRA